MDAFSDKALKLIEDAEGLDQPGKWPGGDSGISLGIGYDLGYVTVDQFESDWGDFLPEAQVERLRAVVGFHGIKAKNCALQLADIRIKKTDADKVFAQKTIPQYVHQAKQAFPGFANLPLDA